MEDDVEILVGIVLQQSTQEANESIPVLAPDGLAQNPSAMHFRSGQQRGGSVVFQSLIVYCSFSYVPVTSDGRDALSRHSF